MLTVSQVGKLSGVSVRTLHHYDEIGLLRPSGRSEAGYRLYAQEDLARLQQVLFFRELGFPLEEIRRILGDPKFDLRAALTMQRQLLLERSGQIHALISAVDVALDALEQGKTKDSDKMFEAFGDYDPSKYEEEVKQRWGNTEAYREASKRTKRYTKKDWETIKAEQNAVLQAFGVAFAKGLAADSQEARDVAERHRQHIDNWYYPVSYALHRGLGEMYVADSRFSDNYDRVKPGLAVFVRDAIIANALTHGEQGGTAS